MQLGTLKWETRYSFSRAYSPNVFDSEPELNNFLFSIFVIFIFGIKMNNDISQTIFKKIQLASGRRNP